MSSDIAVVDVTSRLITSIVGYKRAQSVFAIKAIKECRHQGYADGKWYDEQDTVDAVKRSIKAAMKESGSRSRRLFISVPGEFATTVLKDVSVSFDRKRRVVDDDIDYLMKKGGSFYEAGYTVINTSAVCFSVEGSDRLYGDIRGLEARQISARISYILAENSYIQLFDAIATELGFRDIRYISTEWAECVNLLENEQREGTYALVDIGYLSSAVCVGKGEGLLDLKSFSMGGGHIAGDICEQLDIPFDMAESAKRLVDLNLDYADDEAIVADAKTEVLGLDVQRIVYERLVMFADTINSILSPDKYPTYMNIYLTGEGISSMRGAKKMLVDIMDRPNPVEILTPRLPGFVKPEDSTRASVLLMAETLSKTSIVSFFKRLFSGGKNK